MYHFLFFYYQLSKSYLQFFDIYLLGKGGYVFGNVGLFVCLFVCLRTILLKKLRTDWDEILWRGPG